MIRNLLNPMAMHFPIEAFALEVFSNSSDLVGSNDVISSISRIMLQNDQLANANTLLTRTQNGSGKEMRKVLKDFLPALDSFERILSAARENEPADETAANWIKNMEVVYIKLLNSLKAAGLEPLQTVGRPVDLNFHEVVEYRPTDEFPHHTVIQEIQRGYLVFGQLLREARVIVACNKNEASDIATS